MTSALQRQWDRTRRVSESSDKLSYGTVRKKFVPIAALWLMVWAGYNTGIERFYEPGFPTGLIDLFHALRSFAPHLAGLLAAIIMLKRGSIPAWVRKGPIGLVAIYIVIGLASSSLFSPDPLRALYWATGYGSVAIVVLAVASDSNPLASLERLLAINWMVVTAAVIGLLTAVSFLADLVLIPSEGTPLGVAAYAGPGAAMEFLGMPGTRNTGLGRFAGLAALIVLAKLWEGKKRSVFLCCLLLVSLFGLVLSQGRTAVISFLAGVFVLLWMKPGPRIRRWACALLGLVLLGLTGFYSALWNFITRGGSFDMTFTGRTLTWEESWNLFQHSPLVGLGFQADRVYLYYLAEAQHAHSLIFQALIQTGLCGTVPLVAALLIAWILTLRLHYGGAARGMHHLPFEIPVVLAFVTVSSVTESTFALYSAYSLMLAPCFAYLQIAMHRKQEVGVYKSLQVRPTASPASCVYLGPRLRQRNVELLS